MKHFDKAQCKQRGFAPVIIILGVLLVAGIAGGAYFLGKSASKPQTQPIIQPVPTATTQPSQTVDASPVPNGTGETANWKTYTNKDYIFKYPNNWYVAERSGRVFINNSPIPNVATDEPLYTVMEIGIDYSQESDMILSFDHSSVIIDGIKCAKVIDQKPRDPSGLMYTWILLKKNEVNYPIYYINSDNRGSHDPVIDQILSTFRFN